MIKVLVIIVKIYIYSSMEKYDMLEVLSVIAPLLSSKKRNKNTTRRNG